PTRNVKGWKAPCYLMTDGHYSSYQEMVDKVDWNRYGVVEGKARDPRCENCMVHCGYDPSGALGTNYQRGDNWKNFIYNFAPRPKPSQEGRNVDAFNGASVGKGHLAEAKAELARAQTADEKPKALSGNGCCGSGASTGREALLHKIRSNGSMH
ncbi:DUF3463 domain-containing protein, partial [bacterium]|nr:DUF3463 domain-containing protein [bacterium]